MRALIVAILLLLPISAQAQFAKPPGVPSVVVPNYNVTIAIFARETGFGGHVAVYELAPDGLYHEFGDNGPTPQTDFEQRVTAAGGPKAYLDTIAVPYINNVLARRFPAIPDSLPPQGPGNVNAVNFMLATQYAIKAQNGIQVLAPK